MVGYPTDIYTNPNDYVHKSSGNGTKVGSSKVLKVLSGDAVNIRANSWCWTNGVSPGSPVNPLPNLLTSLIGGVSKASGGKITELVLSAGNVLDPAMGQFLGNQVYNSS